MAGTVCAPPSSLHDAAEMGRSWRNFPCGWTPVSAILCVHDHFVSRRTFRSRNRPIPHGSTIAARWTVPEHPIRQAITMGETGSTSPVAVLVALLATVAIMVQNGQFA